MRDTKIEKVTFKNGKTRYEVFIGDLVKDLWVMMMHEETLERAVERRNELLGQVVEAREIVA